MVHVLCPPECGFMPFGPQIVHATIGLHVAIWSHDRMPRLARIFAVLVYE